LFILLWKDALTTNEHNGQVDANHFFNQPNSRHYL
jgi:hypothetical protein